MNKELTVPFDKNKQLMALIVFPFITTILFLLLIKSFDLCNIIPFYVLIVLQLFLLCSVALFLIGFIFLIFQVISNEPAAILNQKGIWVKLYGFNPWDNVEEIDIYQPPYGHSSTNTGLLGIGIRFKDTSYSKQPTFSGKSRIFWAKLLNQQYHIYLGNIALDNEQVINFAKQFVISKPRMMVENKVNNRNYFHFLKKQFIEFLCVPFAFLVGSFIALKPLKLEPILVACVVIFALTFILVGAYIEYRKQDDRQVL